MTEPWQTSLRGIKIDVKNTFVEFDPRSWHCVFPVKKGTRYSAVYYATNQLEKLTPEDWRSLQKHGFVERMGQSEVVKKVKALWTCH